MNVSSFEGWLFYHEMSVQGRRVVMKRGSKVYASVDEDDRAAGYLRWNGGPSYAQRSSLELAQIESICIGARLNRDSMPVRNGKFRLCFTLCTSKAAYVFRAANDHNLKQWVLYLHKKIFDLGKLPPRLCVSKFFDTNITTRMIGTLLRDGVPVNLKNSKGETRLISAGNIKNTSSRLNKFRPQSLNVSDIEKSYASKTHSGKVPVSPISPISPVSPINALDPETLSKSEEYIKERREERRKRRERRLRRVKLQNN